MQDLFCDVSLIEKVLSQARLRGYQTSKAKKLHINSMAVYRWNILLSESLYPLLHAIEVSLRNSIYIAISSKFQDPDWLLKPAKFLDIIEADKIKKHFRVLEQSGKLGTDHLIAGLNFGFWCSLLDRRYEHKQLLWPTLLRSVFPYLKNRKIHLIRTRFNRIRTLRNRIYHYEPIWHWRDLMQQHDDIIEAIGWIEPEVHKLLEVDRFNQIYQKGPF